MPGNVATTQPVIGTTLTVALDRLPQSVAFLVIGFSRTNSQLGALPISMAPFGAPGCEGRVSPDSTLVLIGAGNTVNWNFAIPAVPPFVGIQFFTQALAVDPGINALGGVMSDAAAMLIGM